MQGFLLSGGTVVLGTSTRPRDVFGLIQRHRVTHIHLVPALLIRWIDDPAITEYDLSCLRVIQSGGQRLQPEGRPRAERAPARWFLQENFGMAEGLIILVRSTDPPDARRETCGRPASPDDEVYLVDEDGKMVPDGEPGELIVRGPYTLRAVLRSGARRADVRLPGATGGTVAVPGGARDVPAQLRDRDVQIARTSGVLRHPAAIRLRQGVEVRTRRPPGE